jgi:DNA (cytosine-5)-methyltransferase 1
MKNQEKLVSISIASETLKVSIDTIRRWEKKGLIRAIRDKSGHRYFYENELLQLKDKTKGKGDVGYKILKNESSTKYKVVELFAGCGGLALGLENAGLKAELLVEIDKKASETLKLNRPKWNVIADDIKNVDFTKVKADVVAGGFPCQAFSYAGKRMGFEDTRGTLFFEFARAIKEIKPKIILGENVKGLEKHDEGRTLKTMLDVLDELGYKATYKVLRAQYFDVPQKRERLVIIGIRKASKTKILFPKEKNYTVSIGEALKGVPKSEGQVYTEKKRKIMELIPQGGYWKDLPDNLQKEYMGGSYFLGGGKTGMARRLASDEPSLTLTCNPAQKQTERCHPFETRPLQIREYARIQSFPDSWTYSGSVASQYKQIGNAVPVNLGFHIGTAIIAMLENKVDSEKFVTVEKINAQECMPF